MVVFYQYWIYYGYVNVYGEYGMGREWGYGVFTKSLSGSTSKNVAANGFTSGTHSSMGTYFYNEWNTENESLWQTPINWNVKESINAPAPNSGGGITETGFRLDFGSNFRDPRGQNAAQINYYCI
jgi:hypothetical protein